MIFQITKVNPTWKKVLRSYLGFIHPVLKQCKTNVDGLIISLWFHAYEPEPQQKLESKIWVLFLYLYLWTPTKVDNSTWCNHSVYLICLHIILVKFRSASALQHELPVCCCLGAIRAGGRPRPVEGRWRVGSWLSSLDLYHVDVLCKALSSQCSFWPNESTCNSQKHPLLAF